jgi:Lar family restriction alleviation protein
MKQTEKCMSDKKSKLRLKSCPFCGSIPEISFELDDIGDYRVLCDCGATCGGLFYSKMEAIEYWNRRRIKNEY